MKKFLLVTTALFVSLSASTLMAQEKDIVDTAIAAGWLPMWSN